MENWRDTALRLGVDQNRPDLLRAAGITPDYGNGANQSYSSYQPYQQPNLPQLAQQQIQLRQQYNQPIIQQTEAQKPNIESRYKTILDELKRKETEQTGKETTRLAREYGARGISLSSDAYQKGLGETLSPISQYYAGQTTQTGVAQQSELDQLNNVIALLKVGNPDQSITEALNLYNQQNEQNRLAQQAEATRQFDLQKLKYENPTEKAYKEAQTRKLLAETGNIRSESGVDNSFLQALQMIMGGGGEGVNKQNIQLNPAPSFQPLQPTSKTGSRQISKPSLTTTQRKQQAGQDFTRDLQNFFPTIFKGLSSANRYLTDFGKRFPN